MTAVVGGAAPREEGQIPRRSGSVWLWEGSVGVRTLTSSSAWALPGTGTGGVLGPAVEDAG